MPLCHIPIIIETQYWDWEKTTDLRSVDLSHQSLSFGRVTETKEHNDGRRESQSGVENGDRKRQARMTKSWMQMVDAGLEVKYNSIGIYPMG